jgi:HTH-type transcriptional regulator/antitoxin HigA
LERLELIFDSKKGSANGDELEILGILIEKYENEHFPIGFPDPMEAIKFRMEQMMVQSATSPKPLPARLRSAKTLVQMFLSLKYKIKSI